MAGPNVLVNLPAGYVSHPHLRPHWARLEGLAGEVRYRSSGAWEAIADDLAWCDAIVTDRAPPLLDPQLDMATRLRFAAMLDVCQPAARVAFRRGLAISHGRFGGSAATAELALTLILGTLRRTAEHHAAMRAGTETWPRNLPDDLDLRERQLTGRPVGIVGFGHVGRRLAELLAPFACPLSVSDPLLEDEVLRSYGAVRLGLGELFERNDVIVICAAGHRGTRHLIGAEQLGRMRPGALLVNVARALIVDTDALLTRLTSGDISAAIDTFDIEPLPAGHPLRGLPNAYLTPHRGGTLMESLQRTLGWLIDDTEAFFAGKARRWAIHEGMVNTLEVG